MLPALSGVPFQVLAADVLRRAALAAYVAAGRTAETDDDVRDTWPADPTDLNALLVLADRYRERGAFAPADELQEVVAHVQWSDAARRWLEHPDLSLPDRAAATRALRRTRPGCVDSDAFERPPPTPPTADLVLGADEGRVAREVAAALAAEPDVFARAADRALVIVHPDGTGMIAAELTAALVAVRASDAARLLTPAGAPVPLPGRIASAVRDDPTRTGFRALAGIVDHPIVAPDGSVIADRRYHRPTGLLVYPPTDLRVEVPVAPTRSDAAGAVELLLDVVCDFPFHGHADRAAWLASALTPLVRATYDGPTPWMVALANRAGTGKGMLMNTVGWLSSGKPVACTTWSRSAEVMRRVIDDQFRAGSGSLCFDNMAGEVGSAVFDAALTATRWTARGVSGPLRTLWYGTGNDLTWSGDTARRVLPVRMRSVHERPETRSGFRHPRLGEYVAANRGRLLSAALTLVRAWICAGRPTAGLPAWGSYEAWSDVVREMIVWVGLPDPAGSRPTTPAESPNDPAAAIVEAVYRLGLTKPGPPSRRGVTARDLVALLGEPPHGAERPEWQRACARALAAALGGPATADAVGQYLRSLLGRPVGGRRIAHATEDGRKLRNKDGTLWTALPVEGGPAILLAEASPDSS